MESDRELAERTQPRWHQPVSLATPEPSWGPLGACGTRNSLLSSPNNNQMSQMENHSPCSLGLSREVGEQPCLVRVLLSEDESPSLREGVLEKVSGHGMAPKPGWVWREQRVGHEGGVLRPPSALGQLSHDPRSLRERHAFLRAGAVPRLGEVCLVGILQGAQK